MAARTRKLRHDDETRAKIQTSQLINRLSDHVFGKVELTPAQVRAAEILLRKTIPDLTAVEHSGEVEKVYVARMPAKVSDLKEWQKQYSPPKPTVQ